MNRHGVDIDRSRSRTRVILILLLTIVAGRASQPEESTGRYTMYFLDLGAGNSVGTGIYGWFYSIPSLILTGILILSTVVSLFLIARPALAEDRASAFTPGPAGPETSSQREPAHYCYT